MKPVYVIDAIRSPIGRFAGSLSSIRPDDLLAYSIEALLSRNREIDPNAIEEVIAGAANQSGEDNSNVARMAALLSDLPASVGGVTVNRLDGSGLQAIMDAGRAIASGDGLLYIAGGVESMSRAPYVQARPSEAFARYPELHDTTTDWRFINPKLAEMYPPYSMGQTAENVARQWNITREQQDEFAFYSVEKYFAAKEAGKWEEETFPVELTNERREVSWIMQDERPSKTSLTELSRLRPAFVKDGMVTSGNSGGMADGSAALLLASEDAVKQFNLMPIARMVSMAISGVDPSIMGLGPVPAVRKALQRAGLTMADIGLVELNETFASSSLACIRDLQVDPALVNVNGGAIAMGHPIGCGGARISTTLLHEMRRKQVRYGLATISVGVGQGAAVIYEGL